MIRSAAIAAAALLVGVAHAEEDEAPAPAAAEEGRREAPAADEDALSPHRTSFDVLAERAIGTTSTPVEFNWRRTTAQVAATGSYLVELNNFNSARVGALVRLPSDGALVELGVTYAGVWESPSSRTLALTPYRQPGRPDRLELDVAVGLPLAEGVVTAAPRFFPAVQMVFVGYLGFRYAVYPTGFAGMPGGEIAGALLSPMLTDSEIENLEDARLPAMQVDLARYGLLVGLGNDLYFRSGFFLSPRLMIALPLLAPATQTDLVMWADLSLAVGLAF